MKHRLVHLLVPSRYTFTGTISTTTTAAIANTNTNTSFSNEDPSGITFSACNSEIVILAITCHLTQLSSKKY